jgi:ketosteroid isomerase-like protein
MLRGTRQIIRETERYEMASAVDTVKSLYAGFASGDVGAVLGALDPGVEWTEAEGFPYGGTYVGRDAVLANVFMKLATEWDGFMAVPAEYVCQGDTVVAIGEYSGTFKATGKHFRAPFVHVWRSRGGALVNFRQHTDTAIVQATLR